MHLQPPMTMMDFFKKSEGTWYIQRSVHHFDSTEDESGESNITVTTVAPEDSRVIEICNQHKVDPSQASGGASFTWQVNLDTREFDPDNAAVLVAVPSSTDRRLGRILRDVGYVDGKPVIGRYQFADDGVLTITTDYDNNQGQERAWFLTDDFRVRVSTVRMMNGVNLMAYCSERRCVSTEQLQQLVSDRQAGIPAMLP
ncbi:MAG: phycobiliprotein lyase [Synechococcus sp.]